MALAGSWSVVWPAHIQAFTFSSQDHGRLSGVCLWRVWCVCVCCCVYMWWCVWCWWCVGCVCTCGGVCGVGGVCCCVVVVRVCGVWWSLAHSLSCSLSFHFSFSFAFPFFFTLIFLFLSSFFSLAPSLTFALALVLSFSSLFSSHHQTLWKEPIKQHGGQHRGIWMWSGARQVHSSRFSPSSSPLPPPFFPSPPPFSPSPQKKGSFYDRNISGEEFIFIKVLN